MNPMKCYVCGQQSSKHAVGCPEYRKPKPKVDEIDAKEIKDVYGQAYGYEDEPIYSGMNRFIPERRISVPRNRFSEKPVTSFLPLYSSSAISGMGNGSIQGCAQVLCKPKRLWIDEQVSPYFNIDGIFIGVKSQYVSTGPIPANLFRTGRWPLTSGSDVITEFGIDLSSWDTILVSHLFTLQVTNISGSAMPFRGCLEVLALKP